MTAAAAVRLFPFMVAVLAAVAQTKCCDAFSFLSAEIRLVRLQLPQGSRWAKYCEVPP
jgi:hypothetical protein